MVTLYKFRGKTYNKTPIHFYNVIKVEFSKDVQYITVERCVPIIIHIFFLLSMIIVLSFFNLKYTRSCTMEHIISVPVTMFYDKSANVLDIDISNSYKNQDAVDISLLSDDEVIFNIEDLEPGQSIGGVKVKLEDELPMKCTVMYTADGYNTKEINSLIVDYSVANDSENYFF